MKKLLISLFISVFIMACSDDDTVITPESNELALQQVAEENPNTAVWVAREDMKSRNGDDMGYGALLNPNSDKLLIFLDGGGACFNELTCAFNLSSFNEDDFNDRINSETSLILNRNNPENQFAEWNFIFVPYATGDVHAGSNASAQVPNGGPNGQAMLGRNNITIILNDLKTYFDNNGGLSEVVLAGSSAGGFGVMPNYFQLKSILATNVPTTAIVDAGQVFLDNSLLTPCLVNQWESLWNISGSFPSDLNMIVQNDYDYDIQKVYEYSSLKYPEDNFGFLSYYEDGTNTFFYGFGQDDCAYPPAGPVSGASFKNGLLDLQNDLLSNLSNWKVFYKNGTSHVFLSDSEFDQTINGTTLNQWLEDLRQGTAIDLLE